MQTNDSSWPDRVAGWPLDLFWLTWVVILHAVEGVIIAAMIGVAGAILWQPAAWLDGRIGYSVARFALVAMCVAAGGGSLRELWRAAVAKWNDCPW